VSPAEANRVSFETTLSAFGNNTGIVVPPELIDQLGAGRRPPVSVELNGYVFRTTVGVMSGQHLVGVSAAIRKETGLGAGDAVRVSLAVETTPRAVGVPDDLAAAFRDHPAAGAFFETLANSLQRYHVDNINGAKTDTTRQRRVDKAIELFLAGRPR
jgi:hypothetical protein